MEFVDGDGNIVVPRAVRPIIDINETALGSKKGARRQFRYGNLHIRDYDSHYTVHMDKVDPRKNPLGHLLIDAPEFVVGAATAILVGKYVGTTVYKIRKASGKRESEAVSDAVLSGYLAGSQAGKMATDIARNLKRSRKTAGIDLSF